MITDKITISAKIDKQLIDNFENFLQEVDKHYPGIRESILINFTTSQIADYYDISFVKCKTDWDRNKKDYTALLMQYNQEDGYLYYAPESSVGHIPAINAVKLFESVLSIYLKQEIGQPVSVKISKVLLNNFFQSLKCWCIDQSIVTSESFSSLINYSTRDISTSITSLLIKKKLREQQTGKVISSDQSKQYTESQFDQFSKAFRTIYMKILSNLNSVISDIQISSVTDGMFKTMILTHVKSKEFFSSKAYRLINTYQGSNLMAQLTHNYIFNPNIRTLFESYANSEKPKGVNTGKYGQAYLAASKLYQAVDMLTDYELSVFEVAPTLGLNVVNALVISKFKSADRNKFILMLKDLHGFFDYYSKVRGIPSESNLQKALDNLENNISNTSSESLEDVSIYQLNDRLLRQLISVFS